MQRRQVLAATAGAGIGALAGCLEDECPPRTDAETPPEGWPTPGFDAANAGIGEETIDGNDVDADDRPLEADSVKRWRVSLWEAVDVQGGASAPVVDDERVYVAYGRPRQLAESGGSVLALDEATGDLEWEVSFSTDAAGAPVLVGDGVLVGDADGTLRRLECATGDRVWETDLGSAVRTPAVADGWCYVQCDDGRVVAVDVETGDECWTARYGGLRERVGFGDEYAAAGRPAVTDDAVVVTTGIDDDSAMTAVVRVLARESGEERWDREIDGRLNDPPRSPVVAGETVFVAAPERLLAFDSDGGLEWTFATGVRETSAPAVDDDTVYLAAKNAYALDRETGEERWRHVNLAPEERDLGSERAPLTAVPAVAGGIVAVGFGALERETGAHLWGDVGNDVESDYFPGTISGNHVPNGGPAIANGALYATTTDGRIAKVSP